MEKEFEIIRDREHYKVLCNGKFFCTTDTEEEANEEIKKELTS